MKWFTHQPIEEETLREDAVCGFCDYVRRDGLKLGWIFWLLLPSWSLEKNPTKRFDYQWGQRCLAIYSIEEHGWAAPWEWHIEYRFPE